MRLSRTLVLAAALAVLAGGCTTIKDRRGYLADAALIDSVQPGIDNKTSVERALGRPTFASQFGDPAWYYVSMETTQKPFARPATASQMVLRVRFDAAGNVLAVDRTGMEKVAKIDPEGKKTPTLGRDRSFFEDLFGNIGAVGAPGSGGGAGGGGPNGS
jgi:outer membrane protein assembly factor BamE (lipoprotein component of BamABCDE complex)